MKPDFFYGASPALDMEDGLNPTRDNYVLFPGKVEGGWSADSGGWDSHSDSFALQCAINKTQAIANALG